jgi:hypothetical protein
MNEPKQRIKAHFFVENTSRGWRFSLKIAEYSASWHIRFLAEIRA